MRIAIFGLTTTLIIWWAVSAFCDEPQADRKLTLVVPIDVHVDDATLDRLAQKYSNEKRSFLALLLTLEANQVDYSRDSLSDIDRKRRAVFAANAKSNSIVAEPFSKSDLRIDYMRLCWEVAPRLSSNVITVGRGKDVATLAEALKKLNPGDRVELAPGNFTFSVTANQKFPTDVEIVGAGRDKTKLTIADRTPRVQVTRWRLSDLTVDFGVDNRPSQKSLPTGSVCVERCTIQGSAIMTGFFGHGKHLLVEDSLLDASQSRFSTQVLGHSNSWQAVYMRNTIVKVDRMSSSHVSCPLVLDKCELKSDHGMYWHANPLFTRKTSGLRQPRMGTQFEFATDDDEVIQLALGKRKKVDGRIDRLAEATKLHRNPFFWIGLLRHKSSATRLEAAQQVKGLLGQEISTEILNPVEEDTETPQELKDAIAKAIRQLKSDEFAVRQNARDTLIELGDPSIPALQAITKDGTLEQRRTAERLLEHLVGPSNEQPVPHEWELEYGRIARWYAEHRQQLEWNEATNKYE